MTISTTAPRVVYQCDGVTTLFPVPIQAYLATDFTVILTNSVTGAETTLALGGDYTMATSGSQTPPQWALTSIDPSAWPATDYVSIILTPQQNQQTQLVQGQAFPSQAMQTALDRTVQMVQRLQDQLNRSIHAPDGDVNPAGFALPAASLRANMYFTTDANGNIVLSGTLPASTTFNASTVGALIYPKTNAEATAGLTIVQPWIAPGYPERYEQNITPGTTDMTIGWIAAVAQAAQSGGTSVKINTQVYLNTSSQTVPAGVNVQVDYVDGGAIKIGTGLTLTFLGTLTAGPYTVFTGAGLVAWGNSGGNSDGQAEVLVEWWGARADSNGTGTQSGQTNNSTAILAAIASTTAINAGAIGCGTVVRLGAGVYGIGSPINNLATAVVIRGRGRWSTQLVALAGFAGAMMMENANGAAKIILEDFALNGNGISTVTYGLYLGYQSVASPHGTEGYLRGLFITAVTNGTGFAVFGNVGFYDLISVWGCLNNITTNGAGNMYSKIVSEGNVGAGTAVNFNGVTSCHGLEIEAPSAASLPLNLLSNISIDGLIFALADGITLDHLVSIGASAATWAITNLSYVFGSSQTAIVTNGNFKRADGSYFAGNATGSGSAGLAPHGGEGNLFSETGGMKPANFHIRLLNNAGTLQHRFSDAFGGTVTQANLINGATSAYVNTPTGADASTPFANGAKISTVQTNALVCASAGWPASSGASTQRISDSQLQATLSINGTATAGITVIASFQSFTVNGVTRNYLTFNFYTASGTAFALTTGNIPASAYLDICFNGYLSP